jgi:hypothetical protein
MGMPPPPPLLGTEGNEGGGNEGGGKGMRVEGMRVEGMTEEGMTEGGPHAGSAHALAAPSQWSSVHQSTWCARAISFMYWKTRKGSGIITLRDM